MTSSTGVQTQTETTTATLPAVKSKPYGNGEGKERQAPVPDRGHDPIVLLAGLSGLSSSGKTTIARLLKEIFTFHSSHAGSNDETGISANVDIGVDVDIESDVLHQDDFYPPEDKLPLVTYYYHPDTDTVSFPSEDYDERIASPAEVASPPTKKIKMVLQDWDSALSINFNTNPQGLLPCLEEIKHSPDAKSKGKIPAWLLQQSLESQNTTGPRKISPETVQLIKKSTLTSLLSTISQKRRDTGNTKVAIRIVFVDGFLLYHHSSPVLNSFDTKLFLLTAFSTAKNRRKARDGYVTLEGFWKDPDGYFEGVVWPNYVKYHSYLFRREGGIGEDGEDWKQLLKEEVTKTLGIEATPRLGMNVEEVLRWAVERVLRDILWKISKGAEGNLTL